MSLKKTYQPYTLYRRGDLWIKDEFNQNNDDESSLNYGLVTVRPIRFKKNPTDGDTIFTEKKQENIGQPGTYYWSLYANKPCAVDITFDYGRCDKFNDAPPVFYEYKFDAGVFGSGWLRNYVTALENIISDGTDSSGNQAYSFTDNTDNMVQKFWGPCSWQISDYHRLLPGDWLQFVYTNNGKTDPLPRCEVDNITVYPYYEINCEIAHLTPGKPDTQPKKIQVLRGFNTFQTTSNISTEFDVTLRFYDTMSFNNFTRFIDHVHVLCDEQGILYRGTLELDTSEYFGNGMYEQKAKFYSHSKLGLGWV